MDPVVEVNWTAKETGSKLILSNVYWNPKTGEILQAGSQFGDLVL